MSAKN